MGIIGLLAAFDEQLDHAAVPEAHGVLLVHLNADGRGNRPVDAGDDKGESKSAASIQNLGHEK